MPILNIRRGKIKPPDKPVKIAQVSPVVERTASTTENAGDSLQSTAIESTHGSGGQFVAIGGGRVVPASEANSAKALTGGSNDR